MAGIQANGNNKINTLNNMGNLNIDVNNVDLALDLANKVLKYCQAPYSSNDNITLEEDVFDVCADDDNTQTEDKVKEQLAYLGNNKKQLIDEYLESRPDVKVAYETSGLVDKEKQKELEETIIELLFYRKKMEELKEYIMANVTSQEEKRKYIEQYKDVRKELTDSYLIALFKISDEYVKDYGTTSDNYKKAIKIKEQQLSQDTAEEVITDIPIPEISVTNEEPSITEPDNTTPINNTIDGNIECQEFFEQNSEGMYGSNQRVFRNMCIYVYNGQEYEYRQIMKIVNKAVQEGKPIPKITLKITPEYKKLIEKLKEKGFTEKEAYVILESIDDQGACSYATTADNIFYSYRNNPEQFEKDFGYSMYTTINGKRTLNSPALLLDLWLYANDTANGGEFITNNHINTNMLSRRVDIFGNKMLKTKNQVYLANGRDGINDDVIEGFLKSKNKKISFKSNTIINNINCGTLSPSSLSNLVEKMKEELNNNKSLRISIYYDKKKRPQIFHLNADDPCDSITWSGSGHSMAITGIADTGIIVSNKGKKYVIPFEDFMNGGSFNIYSSELDF